MYRSAHCGTVRPSIVSMDVRGSVAWPIQQLPRPTESRLRLESDSLWRGAAAPAPPTYSVGRGSDGAHGHLSVQPVRPTRIRRSVSPRTVSRFGRSARCPTRLSRDTPDEDQIRHRPRKAAMYGVRSSQQRTPRPRRMHRAAVCMPHLPTAKTALSLETHHRRCAGCRPVGDRA